MSESNEEYLAKFELELSIVQASRKGCQESLQLLAKMTLPLRRALTYRYLPGSPSLHEDSMQVGFIGVMKALEKYDESRKVCFCDWARFDISWAIRDFKCKMERSVARPHWVYRKFREINSHLTEDTKELSELMDYPAHKLEQIRSLKNSEVSLNASHEHHDDSVLLCNALIHSQTPCDDVAKQELLKLVLEQAGQLGTRERFILNIRYGLAEGEPRTHAEIGEKLGLTRQRIEQIETEALAKIRKAFIKYDRHLEVMKPNKKSKHSRKRRNFCRRQKKVLSET